MTPAEIEALIAKHKLPPVPYGTPCELRYVQMRDWWLLVEHEGGKQWFWRAAEEPGVIPGKRWLPSIHGPH